MTAISGMIAADNHVDGVYLNGTLISGLGATQYQAFTSFSITSGFVSGLNTLDFYAVDDGAPAGFNVQLTGQGATGPSSTVPEPSTWALLGGGLAGVGLLARRRRAR